MCTTCAVIELHYAVSIKIENGGDLIIPAYVKFIVEVTKCKGVASSSTREMHFGPIFFYSASQRGFRRMITRECDAIYPPGFRRAKSRLKKRLREVLKASGGVQ